MIDIVLASKFRVNRLLKTVDNLLDHATNVDTKLILVADIDDNDTVVAVKDLAAKNLNKITYLINEKSSEGSVIAFNSGTAVATQKYVLWFADDNKLECHGWDDLAIQLLEENPEYCCLSIRASVNDNYVLPWTDAEYGHSFIINREKFKELGYFNTIYKRYYSDPDFFLHMICSQELIMVSKDIVFTHMVEHDKLFEVNNVCAPGGIDSKTFWDKWTPRQNEVIEKFEKIKDKWGKLV